MTGEMLTIARAVRVGAVAVWGVMAVPNPTLTQRIMGCLCVLWGILALGERKFQMLSRREIIAMNVGAFAAVFAKVISSWVSRGTQQEQRGLQVAAIASVAATLGSLVLLGREIKSGAVLTAKVASYLTSMIVAFHVAAFCASKWDMSQ